MSATVVVASGHALGDALFEGVGVRHNAHQLVGVAHQRLSEGAALVCPLLMSARLVESIVTHVHRRVCVCVARTVYTAGLGEHAEDDQ